MTQKLIFVLVSVVRLYSYDGSLLHNLIGHENFVFSSRLLHSGEFATAADDASIRIWKGFSPPPPQQQTKLFGLCSTSSHDDSSSFAHPGQES